MQSSSEMVIALAFHWVWEEEELLLLLFMLLFAQRVHFVAPATGFASEEVYCLNAIGSKYRVSHLLWVCLSNNRYVRQTIKDLEYFTAAFLLKKQGLTFPVCGSGLCKRQILVWQKIVGSFFPYLCTWNHHVSLFRVYKLTCIHFLIRFQELHLIFCTIF